MITSQANKSPANKSQRAAGEVAEKHKSSTSDFQFTDNRQHKTKIAQLQGMLNNSQHTMQLQAAYKIANMGKKNQQIAQLQAMIGGDLEQLEGQERVVQKKRNETGLPDNLKTGMENLSGMSLDDVRVHRNSDKPAQLQAHAYAQGTDIHLASGQEKHLPHEAWHVVQQKQGRVKPTIQLKGSININDDEGLEKEADVMGQKAIQRQWFSNPEENTGSTSRVIQRVGYAVVQRVTEIPRPTFSKEVTETIKLEKGQHRRHVVMSSRMREAIWAYHTTKDMDSDTSADRRAELQTIVGKNTLRTEMGEMTRLVHNSMGNLFAGKGSENTAIGFAVNPLYEIAGSISSGKLKDYDAIVAAVDKWHGKGIFGFALEDKKSIGQVIINWLDDTDNHDGDLDNIASAIRDFAFSCSFDLAYEKGDDEDDHDFPSHIDKEVQAKLLNVAQVLEEVISSPGKDHSLYGALEYLLEIADNYK